jgi:hypothetical protein
VSEFQLAPPDGTWIAVDLDGTLAVFPDCFPDVGPPIPRMVETVKRWIAEGHDVRIFTARVCIVDLSSEFGTADEAFAADQRAKIDRWCLEHLGITLPITAQKDFLMRELFDDRCIQMVSNEGITAAERFRELILTVGSNHRTRREP